MIIIVDSINISLFCQPLFMYWATILVTTMYLTLSWFTDNMWTPSYLQRLVLSAFVHVLSYYPGHNHVFNFLLVYRQYVRRHLIYRGLFCQPLFMYWATILVTTMYLTFSWFTDNMWDAILFTEACFVSLCSCIELLSWSQPCI